MEDSGILWFGKKISKKKVRKNGGKNRRTEKQKKGNRRGN